MIDIKGLDKAKVLLALYNRSHVQGMGIISATNKFDYKAARKLIDDGVYDFDYLYGRIMKVNIAGDSFEERLYDRDNGYGAAADAIDSIRN